MKNLTQQNGFIPPWWCKNRHQQTIWRMFFGETPVLPLVRERWETSDDDFLDLDFLLPNDGKAEAAHTPTVLCLHGLEGSSQSKYILGMLRSAWQIGWRGVALNFRSCSGEINRQPRFYHSGETTDLDGVIRQLRRRWPEAPLFVIGFSLGGNVLLKWLGEHGTAAGELIQAAAAISVPFDLGVAAHRIDSGLGRLYGQNFLPTLKEKMLEKAAVYPALIDAETVRRMTSYIQFEDEAFAPLHHFKNAEDYWRRSSAKYFLDRIRLPTLIIHAADDPFLPWEELPFNAFRTSQWLSTEIAAHGGHVGFVQGTPWHARYWAESRTMAFLSDFLSLSAHERAGRRCPSNTPESR